jgi:hypothetical protein
MSGTLARAKFAHTFAPALVVTGTNPARHVKQSSEPQSISAFAGRSQLQAASSAASVPPEPVPPTPASLPPVLDVPPTLSFVDFEEQAAPSRPTVTKTKTAASARLKADYDSAI